MIHVVANPVRGLLDRKRSEEHLPSSNESKEKHKHTNDKEIGTGNIADDGRPVIIWQMDAQKLFRCVQIFSRRPIISFSTTAVVVVGGNNRK